MDINSNAPVIQKAEIFIEATPSQVWGTLISINTWPEWNERIQKAAINKEVHVGGKFIWKTNGSTIRSTFHTVKPKQKLGWFGRALGAMAIHNWFLEEHQGFTKVIVEESMEGWLVLLLKSKMNEILQKDMSYWLESLKEKVEKDNT